MLKGSALYIVIVISLVVAIICSALITVAYFYKAQYQKQFRYDQLENNLSSGLNILLATSDSAFRQEKTISLFGTGNDSVSLKSSQWGVFDVGVVQAFIQKDTLYKTFTIANTIDSSKWETLYLKNEDKPISVSGRTKIQGNVHIPKAGVIYTFIDNQGYEGDKRLVIGKQFLSEKKIPVLDTTKLNKLQDYFTLNGDTSIPRDTVVSSFTKPTRTFNFRNKAYELKNLLLKGNIIIYSDTVITIDSTSKLNNVLVIAKAIVVKHGFKGTCQLFATDSISVGKNSTFQYPSCLGILRFRQPVINSQAKIILNDNSVFKGVIFSYESSPTDLKPLIVIGKKDTVTGQIYSQGPLQFRGNDEVDGNVITNRFLYQTSFNFYEDYLVNVTLNSKALSGYYLTSQIFPVASKKKQVMQWLEKN